MSSAYVSITRAAGRYDQAFHVHLAPGVYVYSLDASSRSAARKMVVVKELDATGAKRAPRGGLFIYASPGRPPSAVDGTKTS
jgi:hypothetical protein